MTDAVASSTDARKASTGETINAVLEAVSEAVATGDTVQFIGFGSFSQGTRAASAGRIPATGQEIRIAAAQNRKIHRGQRL